MRKAPVDLQPGDLIVGMARSLLKVVSVDPSTEDNMIGSRIVRTTFVSPFTVCEELQLSGAAMIDVWDDSEGKPS